VAYHVVEYLEDSDALGGAGVFCMTRYRYVGSDAGVDM